MSYSISIASSLSLLLSVGPPVINDAFFPGRPGANELRASVRPVEQQLVTIMPIIAPLNPSVTVIADESLLTNTVSIACKADGRPKASITWFMQVAGDANRQPVDLQSSSANESSTSQGRSILTVALSSNTDCVTYFCDAENGGPTVMGRLEVCPQREYSILCLPYCV